MTMNAQQDELAKLYEENRVIRKRLGIPESMSDDEGIEWKMNQHEQWCQQIAEKVGIRLVS